MSRILQLKYDELDAIVKTFNGEGEDFAQLLTATRLRLQNLRKDWAGEAAEKFFAEMEQDLLPALMRVSKAHFFAQDVLMKIVKIIREADEENANFFKNEFQSGEDFGASGFEAVLGRVPGDSGEGGLGGDFGASEFEAVTQRPEVPGSETGNTQTPSPESSSGSQEFERGGGGDQEGGKGGGKTPETQTTPARGGGGGGSSAASSQGLRGDLKGMGAGMVDQTSQLASVGSRAPEDLPDHLFGSGGSGGGATPSSPSPAPGGGSSGEAVQTSSPGTGAAAVGVAGVAGSAAAGAAAKAIKDAKKDKD